MATNPELEAAIEKDPDDEDAYLVYSDWLQTEGDPRGELIAMQAAALRDPGDKKIAQRVTELLARHDEVLLGELGGEMSVGWHLGFVKSVRLAADKDPAKPVDALRALLEHPSGRFVQSISFAQPKGIDPKKVVKLLVEKRPLTLAELRIGGNWDIEADAPELREMFPRLHRSLDVEWRRILKLLSEQRAQAINYDADKLPRLVPLPDIAAEGVSPEHILLGLRLEIDKRKEIGMVAALKRSFTPESLDKFAIALGEQFSAAQMPTNMRWGFLAMGRIGGDQSVAWIASRVGEWSHARAVQGAELLGQLRSGSAIWELYAMAADTALNRPRREDAGQVLARVANERRMDLDRLLDRSVPPVIVESKKRVTRGAKHDPRSRIRDAAIRRLEAHMVDGRRIARHDFMHYFVRHPVIAPLTRRVVWATYDGSDVEATFRIDAEGNALDAAGDTVDLDGANVGVLHPAELPASERRATLKEWTEVFDDEEIEPLFSQLDRLVYELRDTDQGESITRFKLRSAGFDQLGAMESESDWTPVEEEQDGFGPRAIGYTKLFRRDGVLAYAELDGPTIGRVSITRGEDDVAFRAIHPVTASEILAAVENATTRPKSKAEVKPAATADEPAHKIVKGMRVKIHRGANRLREGTVFWLGDGNNGPRCGIKTDEDETLWANCADVKPTAVVDTGRDDDDDADDDAEGDEADQFIAKATKSKPAKAEAPALAKGTLDKGVKVQWKKGRHSGTGVVFWIGKNKFGEGMRAGVKDDETGETVWADADDCKPTE